MDPAHKAAAEPSSDGAPSPRPRAGPPPGAPPSPKPAATVVVVRSAGAGSGVEVLVLRRSRRSRFAPGFIVFPGGGLEPSDATLAARLFGESSEAARACALRELAEETALLLTRRGLRALRADERFDDAVAEEPPALEQLPLMARWIAPQFLSVRFDASFFAVAAPSGLRATPDGVESDRVWWARPADLLAEHRLFETLMWPTYRTLQELARCRTVDEAVTLRIEQEPPPLRGAARSPEWQAADGADGT